MNTSKHECKKAKGKKDTLLVKNIVQNCGIPVAVRFAENNVLPFGADVSFLLYKCYRSRKYQGRTVYKDGQGQSYAVYIPEQYKGWFTLVNEDGKSAIEYASIKEVVNARLSYFISCYELSGYKLLSKKGTDNKAIYSKISIMAGQVIRLLGVFKDTSSSKSSHGSLQYAQCSSQNTEFFVAFTQSGSFYEVGHKQPPCLNKVHHIFQLLRTRSLPLKIRLICGNLPFVPTKFVGVFHVEKICAEESVIAATIPKGQYFSIPFEISIDCDIPLIPYSRLSLCKSKNYQKAKNCCQTDGEFWRKQMYLVPLISNKCSRNEMCDDPFEWLPCSEDPNRYKVSHSFPKLCCNQVKSCPNEKSCFGQRANPSLIAHQVNVEVHYSKVIDDVSYATVNEDIYSEIPEINQSDQGQKLTLFCPQYGPISFEFSGFVNSSGETMSTILSTVNSDASV